MKRIALANNSTLKVLVQTIQEVQLSKHNCGSRIAGFRIFQVNLDSEIPLFQIPENSKIQSNLGIRMSPSCYAFIFCLIETNSDNVKAYIELQKAI